MVELVVKRIREAMPMQNSSILLVGRGSSDTQPIHELQLIGATVERKLGCQYPVPFTPFYCRKDITSTASHVYVMPYLLFTGLLLQKLNCIQKI